jgi:5-(carboxyamino)imidazole ribonucleotide synthase
MLALAGYPLGFTFRCLDPAEDPCAADLIPHIRGNWDDPEALRTFVDGVDMVTFETENIPLQALDCLESWGVPFHPGREALQVTQDRLLEKTYLRDCGFQTAPFASVSSLDEARHAAASIHYPVILKTRRFGYDGKGQKVARNSTELEAGFNALQGQDLLLEGYVSFEAEGSLIAVRDKKGHIQFYPLIHNEHRKGILYRSEPWIAAGTLERSAREAMKTLMEKMGYVGTMTLEFFSSHGRLIANELAPRVHNSGHWTIDAAVTCQFENHLRAITGLPLGSVASQAKYCMLNVIGQMPPRSEVLKIAAARLHDYHKAPAPGRKLGHITLVSDDQQEIEQGWQDMLAFYQP